MKKSDAMVALMRIGMDVAACLGAFMLAYQLRMEWYEISFFGGLETLRLFPPPNTLYAFSLYWDYAWAFAILLLGVLAVQGRYRLGADEKFLDELQHTFWGVAASMTLLLGYFFFTQEAFFSRLIFGLAWVLTLFLLWLGRGLIRGLVYTAQSQGWGVVRVLLLGTGSLAEQVREQLAYDARFQAVGVLSEKKATTKTWHGRLVWGTFKQLGSVLKKHPLDEVWLASSVPTSQQTAELLATAHQHHVKFKLFPDALGLDLAAVKVSNFRQLPVLELLNSPLQGWGAVVKFALDFLWALLLLVTLSPILLVIGMAVWLTDLRAPIIYRSQRVGANGKNFTCFKFRTMVADADEQKAKLLKQNQRRGGVLFKIEDDPRITNLGHWLRKYSLDELPQLFNVLRGEMSLVGPRPHLPEEVQKYPFHNRQLLQLRPGLTGMAQINGRSSLSFADEMKHEMFYLKNWTLHLDAMIVYKTIRVVLRGEDAS